MSVYDRPLSFPSPLAVYFESGDYIVHNYKRNTWAVFSPAEYAAFSKMRTGGLTPREAMAAVGEEQGLGQEAARHLVGRVLMTAWMRRVAAAPGAAEELPDPESLRLTRTVPKAVYFVSIYRCNLACAYCYAESSPLANTQGDLTTAEALDVVDQIADLGVEEITFTGGEALLRKDIFDLITRAKARGLRCNLITNGTPVTPEKARRLAELADQVTVSIDTPAAEGHDAMRGTGSHRAAVRALDLLQEAGVDTAINTTLSASSVHELSAMVEWAADRGIKLHRFGYVSDLGRGEGAGLAPTKQERFDAEAKLFQTLARRLGEIDLNALLYLQAPPPQAVLKKHCGVGMEEISIDSKGDVYPCKLLHEPEFVAGNLRQQSLREIWERSLVLRQMEQVGPDNLPGCEPCTFRYACGGGCRAHQRAYTGDLYGTNNAECPSLRRAIRRHMWLQDRRARLAAGTLDAAPAGVRC